MTPIRLRHAKGVSTIDVNSNSTVQDLQQEIYTETQIIPSRQIRLSLLLHPIPIPILRSLVKSGYPPRTLTIVPELPFDSLGLQRGDQIIVSEAPNPDTQIPLSPTTHPPVQRSPQSPSGPDHVEVDASFLIHRVNRGLPYLFLVITHSKR